MNYQQEIVINKPQTEVVEKFSDPDSIKHWQRGFISIQPIKGAPGANGSQNLLKYKMGSREIEMKETILRNNLPTEFDATYEAKGVYNHQTNIFTKIDDHSTKWLTYTEFKFSGFMKLIGWIMPGTFKKQSYKYMEDFKAFVEDEKSVLD